MQMKMKVVFNKDSGTKALALGGVAVALLQVACGSQDPTDPAPASTYQFESRFQPGESSVSYTGQIYRHALIEDLTGRIAGLTARIDDGTLTPTTGAVVAELDYFLSFDGQLAGNQAIGISGPLAIEPGTYRDLSSSKDLVGKLAGNDPKGQHRDWSTDFVGWNEGGVTTPESLVRWYFAQIEALAIDRASGRNVMGPGGEAVSSVSVDAQGRDYRQLVQKFLGVAVAFSQGADDYLDDDTDGKGLRLDNTKADGDKPYSALEHQWDEGFGYFGAARNFGDYTDDEIAGKGGRPDWQGHHDTNGDGRLQLVSECNFGHSVNAAKRDRGSADSAKTDYTQQAFDAFLAGRSLIAGADGALSAAQTAELAMHRDRALDAWERAIAATVVHYVNDTLQDMAKFGTPDYDFESHAKHWSELKGFALGLQFNRRSPVSAADFAQFHELVGTAPALPGAPSVDAYKTALLQARKLLRDAYGFDPANMGDDAGQGGW